MACRNYSARVLNSENAFRCFFLCVEFLFSSQKLAVVERPTLVDAAASMKEPAAARNRQLIQLRISALAVADIEAVVRDLDDLCTDVVRTHTLDADKYGAAISSLTDMQVYIPQA